MVNHLFVLHLVDFIGSLIESGINSYYVFVNFARNELQGAVLFDKLPHGSVCTYIEMPSMQNYSLTERNMQETGIQGVGQSTNPDITEQRGVIRILTALNKEE